ncbi:MAG: hypothetical protein RBU30_21555 [Polyangia bacterium]|jgi:hypothetical protein|nr:hypothetical protein [Polyangia bacterium]
MASNTKILMSKRDNRLKAQGRKRKNKSAIRSTLTATEIFAEVDAAQGKKKTKK